MRPACFIVLALLAAIWCYKVVLNPRPFWISQVGDGEVVCYFNSMAMSHGHRPPNAMHPGTPFFAAGAPLVKLLGNSPMSIERFLPVGYLIGLLAVIAGIVGLTRLLPVGLPGITAGGILLSYWILPSALGMWPIWVSYMFELPLGCCALWVLWKGLKKINAPNPAELLLGGFTAGLLCAVHLLFIPLILAGLAGWSFGVWAAWRSGIEKEARQVGFQRAFSLSWAALIAATFLFYLRLNALNGLNIPDVMRRRFWVFLYLNLILVALDLLIFWGGGLVRKGRILTLLSVNFKYITGVGFGWLAGTFLVLDRFFSRYSAPQFYDESAGQSLAIIVVKNVAGLISRSPIWAALVVVVLGGCLFVFIRDRTRTKAGFSPSEKGMAGALCAGLLISILLALRRPGLGYEIGHDANSTRYLLLSSVMLVFGLAWLSRYYYRLPKSAHLAAIALSAAVWFTFGLEAARHLDSYRNGIRSGWKEKQIVDAKLDEIGRSLGRPPMALMVALRRPSCMLRWGSAVCDFLFDAELDRLFPYEGGLDIRTKGAIIPRDGRLADVLLIRESEIKAFEIVYSGFHRWLEALGPNERFEVAPSDSVILVRVTHAVPLTVQGAGGS